MKTNDFDNKNFDYETNFSRFNKYLVHSISTVAVLTSFSLGYNAIKEKNIDYLQVPSLLVIGSAYLEVDLYLRRKMIKEHHERLERIYSIDSLENKLKK